MPALMRQAAAVLHVLHEPRAQLDHAAASLVTVLNDEEWTCC